MFRVFFQLNDDVSQSRPILHFSDVNLGGCSQLKDMTNAEENSFDLL